MLSGTLQSGLERYRIGQKVKALRTDKELGLVQLGEHTGLSPAMLSKIERGQLFPTLPTLLRIAMVFGVGLEHFFVEERQSLIAVIRKAERIRLPDRPGDKAPSYFFESLDFPVTERKMEAYFAEFPAGAKASKAHRHKGAEFIYALSGQLALAVDGRETVLEAGDTVYFDPDSPHSYRAHGNAACTALVVVAA